MPFSAAGKIAIKAITTHDPEFKANPALVGPEAAESLAEEIAMTTAFWAYRYTKNKLRNPTLALNADERDQAEVSLRRYAKYIEYKGFKVDVDDPSEDTRKLGVGRLLKRQPVEGQDVSKKRLKK